MPHVACHEYAACVLAVMVVVGAVHAFPPDPEM